MALLLLLAGAPRTEHYQLARSIISWRGALSAGAEHYQLAGSINNWRGGDSRAYDNLRNMRWPLYLTICS